MAKDDKPDDKRISLAPLDFEEALEGLLQAGPHPKDDEPEPEQGKKTASPNGRRGGKRGKAAKE